MEEVISDLNTFSPKGCKIAAQKSNFFKEFCLISWIFFGIGATYYPYQSRDALSPVGGIFLKPHWAANFILYSVEHVVFMI